MSIPVREGVDENVSSRESKVENFGSEKSKSPLPMPLGIVPLVFAK